MKPPRRSGGFTLVEAVMVIVIIGILSVMVAVFIRAPILGYRDTVARAELSDQTDLALRRIARDIRSALPNSVRVTTSNGAAGGAIEFLQTVSGGRYLAAEDNVPDLPVLDFEGTQANPLQFTVLAPARSHDIVRAGDYVAVYNLGDGFEPANAWRLGQADSNIAQIRTLGARSTTSIGGADFPTATVTLASNPFMSQSVPMPSPERRFQVVRGPVSYYCAARADGTLDLWRAWGYAVAATQSAPPAGNAQRALVASNLASCAGLFDYSSAANQRAGLVVMALALRPRGAGDSVVRLVHQVRVDNAP